MKIRNLAIRNIASIESAEIDFERAPLKDSPLFLICGETGSGKTTILDAITLAIYGRTPRYAGGNRKNDCLIGGMAFNDARQLVRHGATAASAVVELVGNDGKTYEARWSVDAFSRGSSKGRFRRPEWVWKDLSRGGIEYTKDKEIEPVVKDAVGLEFEQFCRTTLLAQGQFTKFLLGNEDEKAEILEKLTNTERFKQFGIAIGEKYAKLRDRAELIEGEIGLLPGLGEERPVVEARIVGLEGKLDDSVRLIKALEARKDWLVRIGENAESEQEVRTEISAAFARLKAAVAETTRQVPAGEASLGEIDDFLVANEPRAKMFAQAEVVLSELGHVCDARAKKAEAERNLAELEKKFPGLKLAKDRAEGALKETEEALSQELAREEFEQRLLDAMNLKQLRKDKEAALKRRGEIETLGVRIAGMDKLISDRKCHETALEVRKRELENKLVALPALEQEFKVAAVKRDAAQVERDKVKSLVDDGIQKIVAELQVGDECPVCKSRIRHLNTSEWFSGLMAEKNNAYAVADRACKEAERALNAAKSAADGARSEVSAAEEQLVVDKKAIKTAHDEIGECAKFFGIKAAKEDVAAALASCDRSIADLAGKLDKGEEQEKVIREISRSLRKLRKDRDEAKESLSVKDRACQDCERDIKQARDGIEAEKSRADKSLAAASAKIVVPAWQAAWEADPDGWESAFKASAAGYFEHKLSLSNAIARLALVEEQRRELEGKRPQDISEGDTVETLSGKCAEARAEADRLQSDLATERQLIKADDQRASERADKERELEAVRAARDEWRPIAELFGDLTGKKIQREIQSYVLLNVLGKANHYLRQLSERYELSCEGLVLSVIDANEGYVVRPVNTLSGGEQFLVSLALALGLAGMNDAGLGVDMLLIDEGFGTLSGEHLNAAIEALERLNALTGSRKVGVISHVERLRERIKTHVEVSRNGHGPSTVKVVSSALGS